MDKKTLLSLLNHKELEIKELSSKILDIKNEKKAVLDKIDMLKEHIVLLECQNAESLAQMLHIKGLIFEKIDSIKVLKSHICSLEDILSQYTQKLKVVYSEKKGLEKLLERVKSREKKNRISKENQLADESYLRKFING